MSNILFICTGNTCRSPMSEALLKSKNVHSVNVRSAGLFAAAGCPASPYAQEMLSSSGIEFTHSAKQLTKEDIEWATYVLVMTNSHKKTVQELYPEYLKKVFTLKEMAGEQGDVTDPFGGTRKRYEETFFELNRLIDRVIKKLHT
ncbi:MAG: low molecular weight protein arginine phosphatase [Bacillus sp. (in: firmicutes)]